MVMTMIDVIHGPNCPRREHVAEQIKAIAEASERKAARDRNRVLARIMADPAVLDALFIEEPAC